MDFMLEQLANGWRFRILDLVDDYSRKCAGQVVTPRSPALVWHAT